MAEIDLHVFGKLEAMYLALAIAATDPVVISNPQVDIEKERHLEKAMSDQIIPFDITRVFFYCEDEEGELIIQERIALHSEDIASCYQKHKKMLKYFYTIEEQANTKNRELAAKNIGHLLDEFAEYIEFVKDHQEKLREKSFIFYPYIEKRLGYRGNGIVQQLTFNKSRTYDMALQELTFLNHNLEYFLLETEPLEISEIYSTGRDSGEGHNDGSYRANIALVKMLLKEHLGFDVEKV